MHRVNNKSIHVSTSAYFVQMHKLTAHTRLPHVLSCYGLLAAIRCLNILHTKVQGQLVT